MIQVSIDPASIYNGYSVLDTEKAIGYDIVKYSRHILHKSAKLSDRCDAIYELTKGLIMTWKPAVFVIEDQFISSKTPRIISTVRLTGCIILACKHCNTPIVSYPNQVVKSTIAKKGNANKELMAKAVKELYKDYDYVGQLEFSDKEVKTKGIEKTDDIFDSIAINLTHRILRNGTEL